MTKKIFLTIVFSLLLVGEMFAQITFQKTFGIAGVFYGSSVQLTNDGGYILVSNDSVTSSDFDILLIKSNSLGDTLWTRTYGGTGKDIGYEVQQTSDMGYIITGSAGSFGVADVYLIKTDSLGALLWSKVIHKTQSGGSGLSVVQTNDGGYLIAGISWNGNFSNPNARDCWLIKVDSNGTLLWDKEFGETAVSSYINKTNDGGYIFSGFISDGQMNFDWESYLVKTDSIGNTQWRKTFGGIGDSEGLSVQQTYDGGFILTGFVEDSTNNLADVLLIKTDNNGDTLWTKKYGGMASDIGQSLEETMDNGFIISGYTTSFGAGSYDVYLIKTDSIGNIIWSKTYGGADADFGVNVHQSLDGGYIINGFTSSLGDGRYHTYLIKTDANGNSGCNESNSNSNAGSPSIIVGNDASFISSGASLITHVTTVDSGGTENTICSNVGINELSEFDSFEIFPNPSSGNFVINSADNVNNGMIEVYNALGEKVFKQSVYHSNRIEINLKNIANGIYFVKLFDGEKNYCKKLIVE